MKWTKKLPTKEGYYWMRNVDSKTHYWHMSRVKRIYANIEGTLFVTLSYMNKSVDEFENFEWSGPIKEPK